MKLKIVHLIIALLLLSIILVFLESNSGEISEIVKENPLHIHAIDWNGTYWLIGGRSLPDGPTFLLSYDGMHFTDITPEELKHVWIGNISWNGTEWIVKELPYTTEWKNLTYSFDGKNLREIERGALGKPAKWEPRETYKACNEEYCLIWSTPGGRLINASLMKYDRKNYTDLTKESGIQLPFESVVRMVWNGKYWLISYGGTEVGGVVKYDGASFTKLNLPTPTTGRAIVWNGEYWLVGTVANPRSSGSLVKYDGTEVIDLTPQIEAALRPSPISPPVSTPATAQPLANYKLAFILAAFLLIALTLYLRWGKKSE